MKKIYLSVDIEGIWGNADSSYTIKGTSEYEQYRKNMIDETNLVIKCLFENGVEEIVVNDGHGGMDNLIPMLLDERVSVIVSKGSYKEYGMMEGIDDTFDGCGFIGYHCKSNTINGNMAHTVSGAMIEQILINNKAVSEAEMNMYLASEYQVPLLFVSGDNLLKQQLEADLGDIEVIVTKKSINNLTVLNSSKQELVKNYQDGITRAIKNPGLISTGPCTLDLVFHYEKNASFVARMPTVQRIDAKTVRLIATNYNELYKQARFAIKICNAYL